MAPGPLLEPLAWTLRSGGFTVYWLGDGGDLPNLILTTPRDWAPAVCREWSLRGPKVVVLAPIPFRHERETYTAAGALYRPMGGRAEELLGELRGLVASAEPRTPFPAEPRGLGTTLAHERVRDGQITPRDAQF